MDQTKKQNLLQIASQVSTIIREIIESDGEVNISTEMQLLDSETALAQKIDRYKYVIEDLEAEKEKWTTRSEEAYKIAKACGNYAERLEEYLRMAMDKLGTKELVGEEFKYVLERPTTSVEVINSELVPQEYKKTKVEISLDKNKIKEDIKAGKIVEGVILKEKYSLKVKGVK